MVLSKYVDRNSIDYGKVGMRFHVCHREIEGGRGGGERERERERALIVMGRMNTDNTSITIYPIKKPKRKD